MRYLSAYWANIKPPWSSSISRGGSQVNKKPLLLKEEAYDNTVLSSSRISLPELAPCLTPVAEASQGRSLRLSG
jgi:hypothetical protein